MAYDSEGILQRIIPNAVRRAMMEKVAIDGITLNVRRQDSASGRQATTIFFVHGSGGDWTSWQEQFLSPIDGYSLAALELPGHGDSGGYGESDIGAYATWVTKVCDKMGLAKPLLVGHSLGAAVCLEAVYQHPKRFSSLVIVAGGARLPVDASLLERTQSDPAAVIAMAGAVAVAKVNRPRLSAVVSAQLSRVKPEILYRDFLACSRFDITGQLTEIAVPALIICGTEDVLTPPRLSVELQILLPEARLEMIAGAGHFPMWEKPDDFNRIIRDFLS